MRLIENNLGTTLLGETEITWIQIKRVFDSEEEERRYDWQGRQRFIKSKKAPVEGQE